MNFKNENEVEMQVRVLASLMKKKGLDGYYQRAFNHFILMHSDEVDGKKMPLLERINIYLRGKKAVDVNCKIRGCTIREKDFRAGELLNHKTLLDAVNHSSLTYRSDLKLPLEEYIKYLHNIDAKNINSKPNKKTTPTQRVRALFLHIAFTNQKFDEKVCKRYRQGSFDGIIKDFLKEKESEYDLKLYQAYNIAKKIHIENACNSYTVEEQEAAETLYTKIFNENPFIT